MSFKNYLNENKSAKIEYDKKVKNVYKLLKDIDKDVKRIFGKSKDSLNWGDVGDVGRLEGDLIEITKYTKHLK